MKEHRSNGSGSRSSATSEGRSHSPGKRTLVDTVYRSANGKASVTGGEAFGVATSGSSGDVPYRAEMEHAFSEDFSGVKAHLGGAAAKAGLDALGARAATYGSTVAFESASPAKELVAHELTHVVQQRRGGSDGPQHKADVSMPGDASEVEADAVAQRVVAGERVTVSGSSRGAVHRDIKESGMTVKMGEFAIDMKKVEDVDFQGEDGTVSFKANDKAPDSRSIRLTQAIRYFDLGTKKDFDWTGSSEEDRSKMNTTGKDATVTTTESDTLAKLAKRFYGEKARAKEIYDANKSVLKSDAPDDKIGAGIVLTIKDAVETGFHVDHFPSDPAAEKRTKKGDKNVPQDYVWPGEEIADKNQHGSKSGETIVPTILKDRPGWNQDMRYSFETVARSDDTGIYYGGLHWGFTIKTNKVVDEHHHVAEAPSQTFHAAVTEFNKFYKNKHVVMKGDTLWGIADRYYGDPLKWEKIYDANKALIKDPNHIETGWELHIPDISAGV